MQQQHFTAWITTDRSALDSDYADVAVMADEIAGYKTDGAGFETDTPDWTSVGDPLFHARTTVPVPPSDFNELWRQSRDLLADGGWQVVGGRDAVEAVDTGWIVEVTQ